LAHKTLINGTAYEISGGRTLVNGTGYSIDKGKTLVGGTAYEVGFGHPVLVYGGRNGRPCPCTVTVDGNSTNFTNAFAIETVSNAAVTVASTSAACKITVNGETVVNGVGEYMLNLSDATHVQMMGNLTMLAITTHNLAVTGEDVPITVNGTGYTGLAYIEHSGVTYTSATTFPAKTGDLIFVHATNPTLGGADYYYLVTSDALINMNYSTGGSGGATGSVGITTIPEGHALVSIKGAGNSSDYYVSIDGTKYISATAVAVPIGTTIYCYVQFEEKDSDYYGLIYLNGTKVASTTIPTTRGDEYYAEYNYTVNGNTTITFSSYVISIREQ
jgi:hypothetical protein